MDVTIAKTNRLLLREFQVDDASFILQLYNEPSWLQFIGDRKVYTLDDAITYLHHSLIKSYQALGFGFWLVMESSTLRPVGLCGLTQRPFLDHPDIGFAFLPDYTGKGYAREAARAVVEFAFIHLKLPVILAYTQPDNPRSTQLLLKLGFQAEEMIMVDGKEFILYRMTQAGFLQGSM